MSLKKKNLTIFQNQWILLEQLFDSLEREKNSITYKDLIIKIANNLSTNYCFEFIYQLNKNNENVKELFEIIVTKVKETYPAFNPFYNHTVIPNPFMEYWATVDLKEFQKYMMDSLNSKTNISNFLNRFTNSINSSSEILDENSYKKLLMTLQLPPSSIYDKIITHFPEFKNLNFLTQNINWKENNSNIEHIKQFIYWYQQDMVEEENTN